MVFFGNLASFTLFLFLTILTLLKLLLFLFSSFSNIVFPYFSLLSFCYSLFRLLSFSRPLTLQVDNLPEGENKMFRLNSMGKRSELEKQTFFSVLQYYLFSLPVFFLQYSFFYFYPSTSFLSAISQSKGSTRYLCLLACAFSKTGHVLCLPVCLSVWLEVLRPDRCIISFSSSPLP